MATPGIGAPAGSVTLPVMVAKVLCACDRVGPKHSNRSAGATSAERKWPRSDSVDISPPTESSIYQIAAIENVDSRVQRRYCWIVVLDDQHHEIAAYSRS